LMVLAWLFIWINKAITCYDLSGFQLDTNRMNILRWVFPR
jgi:hypothetical protein